MNVCGIDPASQSLNRNRNAEGTARWGRLALTVVDSGNSGMVVRDPKRTSRAHAYPPPIYQAWIRLYQGHQTQGYAVVLAGRVRPWRKPRRKQNRRRGPSSEQCRPGVVDKSSLEASNYVIFHRVSDL